MSRKIEEILGGDWYDESIPENKVEMERTKQAICDALLGELPADRTLNKAAREASGIYKEAIIEFFGQATK